MFSICLYLNVQYMWYQKTFEYHGSCAISYLRMTLCYGLFWNGMIYSYMIMIQNMPHVFMDGCDMVYESEYDYGYACIYVCLR